MSYILGGVCTQVIISLFYIHNLELEGDVTLLSNVKLAELILQQRFYCVELAIMASGEKHACTKVRSHSLSITHHVA